MSEITTKVKLPSRGLIDKSTDYEIEMDMIDYEDEKEIFGSFSDEVVDRVLKRKIVSPKEFDIDSITPQDRMFLLIKLRIHSYGDTYYGYGVCPKCGEREYKYSLDDVPVKELNEEISNPEGVLPLSKKKVSVRQYSVGESKKIDALAQEKSDKMGVPFKDIRYDMRMARSINEVDGQKLNTQQTSEFLRSLKGRDLAYIDHLKNKIDFGYDSSVVVKCSCGKNVRVPFRITTEFFRPRFDD